MTDDDLLPNGMRLGQRVRVFSGGGRQFGVMARGEVVGWQDAPTIVIRGEDGQNSYVSSRLGWEPLEVQDIREGQAQAALNAVHELLDTWSALGRLGGASGERLAAAADIVRATIDTAKRVAL